MARGVSTKEKPLPTGPPRELINVIEKLRTLLRNLPEPIPLVTACGTSSYDFTLNSERLTEGRIFSALGHALEVAFRTWQNGGNVEVPFHERGAALEALEGIFKRAVRGMTPGEQSAFQHAWIERLIKAAQDSGAQMPQKKRKAPETSDPPAVEPSPSSPKSVSHTLPPAKRSREETTPNPSITVSEPTFPSSETMTLPAAEIIDVDVDIDMVISGPGKLSGEVAVLSSHPRPTPQPKTSSLPRRWSGLAKNSQQITLAGWATKETLEQCREHQHRKSMAARERHEEARKQQEIIAAQKHEHVDNEEEEEEEGVSELDSGIIGEINGHNVANVSRPDTQKWRKSRNGTRGGTIEAKHAKQTNYFHPFLWMWLEDTIRRNDFKATASANAIHRDPNLHRLFPMLKKGTIQKWIDPANHCFQANVLTKVARGKGLTGTGRAGILDSVPEVKAEIITILKSYRASALPVMVPISQVTILAVLEERAPELLAKSGFICSNTFTQDFLSSTVNWTVWKGTRAVKHIPDNAEELCEEMFFRLAYQGMYLLPNNSYTFAEAGSKQVDVMAKDEKQVFTLVVRNGIDPEKVKISTGLPELQDASVKDIRGDTNCSKGMFINQMTSLQDMLTFAQAWKRSTVKNYDLSAECLSSPETRKALKAYLSANKKLYQEIKDRMGVVHGVGDEE
ncbi:hypothetical protein K438DRAFT_1788336 [Mycena galopus ATCC 62051]|nr:hypothetical protein K438DRAFT_1788336 [Mycena galopus ATCC 62051]